MSDIIIGGVSIAALKKQREDMREEAVKFIAQSIKSAQDLCEQILSGDENTDYEGLATQANKHLENADLVAGATGNTYFLEFYEEYGDGSPLSHRIEDNENEHMPLVWGSGKCEALAKLRDTLGSMESNSRDWHSSRC